MKNACVGQKIGYCLLLTCFLLLELECLLASFFLLDSLQIFLYNFDIEVEEKQKLLLHVRKNENMYKIIIYV